jgi:predicted alpha/beta superfamily hydrolase
MTPRVQLQATPPAALHGELLPLPRFHSRALANERPIVVYLPPGYHTATDRRYPVLYMHDGQNLFDGQTSYISGQHWHLKETADKLIEEGAIEPLIIVGVYHAGEERIAEYTPTANRNFRVGGRADLYGRMLVGELKPFIDRTYRTKPDREETGIGGSSLGGLVSLYLGLTRTEVFGRVVSMSPSLWWDNCWILRRLDQLVTGPHTRIWLDAGTCEGANTDCNAEALRDALVARGFRADEDVRFMKVEGGHHSEQDWAHRVHHALRFTYPAPAADPAPRQSGRMSPPPPTLLPAAAVRPTDSTVA